MILEGEALLETLLSLDGSLDVRRVEAAIETVATPDPRWGGVRLYGEMVGMLWSRRQLLVALDLERVWCDALANSTSISVRCGYPVEVIGEPADLAAIRGYHD